MLKLYLITIPGEPLDSWVNEYSNFVLMSVVLPSYPDFLLIDSGGMLVTRCYHIWPKVC
jgi:hypothetical protein